MTMLTEDLDEGLACDLCAPGCFLLGCAHFCHCPCPFPWDPRSITGLQCV